MSKAAPAAGKLAAPPRLTLGAVLRAAVPRHVEQYCLPSHHWKTLRALMQCRTPALGGHTYRCQDCGKEHFVPHSCRNRHCATCQPMLGHEWMEQQAQLLLPVPYFHVVFTLPHALNGLIAQNQAVLYKLLFDSAAQTLLTFGQKTFQGQLGITMVLHTWGQNLSEHYHVHAIVTGGALSEDGMTFQQTKPHWLFPAKALSKMYRAKYRDGLREHFASGKLEFHGQMSAHATSEAFNQLIKASTQHPWVVYAKRPFAGPQQVLGYLARYTHRVGISDRRLIAQDAQTGAVSFTWKDYATQAAPKQMTLSAAEFVRRLRSHILPPRFVKIRHYGLLSTRNRKAKIPRARQLLPALASVKPVPNASQDGSQTMNLNAVPQSSEALSLTEDTPTPKPVHQCPHCQSQKLIVVRITRLNANGQLRSVPLLDSS